MSPFEEIPTGITASTTDVNHLKIKYKAYGVYSGSYDGGGVSNPLYWNINDARNKCLEYIKGIDEESERMLKWCLSEDIYCNVTEDYYKGQYKPMKEILPNVWSNGMDDVRIVEYDIL